MKTLAKFVSESNLPESLVRAVVRQIGGWESFQEHAQDVTNHGINGGFHGFIYYTDTVKFAKAHKSVILDYAREMASDLGESGAYSMIAGFNCFKGQNLTGDDVADAINNPRHDEHTNVMNALAWFAGEEVCRSYCDMVEA